jgi:hypothetical protein
MALDHITGKLALNNCFPAHGAFIKPIGNGQIALHGLSASPPLSRPRLAAFSSRTASVVLSWRMSWQNVPILRSRQRLLVAPADVESSRHTPEHIRGFAPIPRTPLPFRSVVVASSNDPYMALPRARELAYAWGAKFIDAGPLGHINVDAGFGPWPTGERILRDLILGSRGPGSAAAATPHAWARRIFRQS